MSNANLVAFAAGISFLVLAASYAIVRGRLLLPAPLVARRRRRGVHVAHGNFPAAHKQI